MEPVGGFEPPISYLPCRCLNQLGYTGAQVLFDLREVIITFCGLESLMAVAFPHAYITGAWFIIFDEGTRCVFFAC